MVWLRIVDDGCALKMLHILMVLIIPSHPAFVLVDNDEEPKT